MSHLELSEDGKDFVIKRPDPYGVRGFVNAHVVERPPNMNAHWMAAFETSLPAESEGDRIMPPVAAIDDDRVVAPVLQFLNETLADHDCGRGEDIMKAVRAMSR